MAREFRSASPYMRFGRIDPCYAWDVRGLDHRVITSPLQTGVMKHIRKGRVSRRNMSLDNTSHPGRPGPDELVPSRYALRVGEIDVLVVSDGVLSLPGAMLAHNADPAVRAAWLKDMFLPPDVLEWALNVVVVRSGGRTVLIDAGMGVEYPDLPRTGRLALRLEAAGIDLASVTD